MRMKLALLLAATAGALQGGLLTARAEIQFSAGLDIHAVSDFYTPLGSVGAWVNVPTYGRCWHPTSIAADWRPYGVGQWEWTDVGWYWQSDEPWAWATYHYGGWVMDPDYGWVWVPGKEWAPAWVTWRVGDDYIGWEPCGPDGSVLQTPTFVFVNTRRFHDPIRRTDWVLNDRDLIARTRLVHDFKRENRDFGGHSERVVVNTGPSVGLVQKAIGRNLTRRPVSELVSQTKYPKEMRRSSEQNVQAQRRDQNLSRTGRETPQVYQQQSEPKAYQQRQRTAPVRPDVTPVRPSVTPPDLRQNAPAPTGRETPRVYQKPVEPKVQQQPGAIAPVRPNVTPVQPNVTPVRPNLTPVRPNLTPPDLRQNAPAPTGRETPRVYPDTTREKRSPEPAKRVEPAKRTPEHPATPPDQSRDGEHRRDGEKDH